LRFGLLTSNGSGLGVDLQCAGQPPPASSPPHLALRKRRSRNVPDRTEGRSGGAGMRSPSSDSSFASSLSHRYARRYLTALSCVGHNITLQRPLFATSSPGRLRINSVQENMNSNPVCWNSTDKPWPGDHCRRIGPAAIAIVFAWKP
jgi:hypothetical protein